MGNPCHVGAHVLMKEMHNKWTNIQIQVNVRGFEEWQGIVKRQNVTGRECLFGECHPQEALAEKVTVAQKNEQSEGASHRNPQWRVFQRRELTKALRKHLAVPWTLACSGSSEEAKMARVAGTTETLAGSEVREGRGNHTGSAQCAKEFEFHSKWYGKILTGCEQKNTVFFFFTLKNIYLQQYICFFLSLPVGLFHCLWAWWGVPEDVAEAGPIYKLRETARLSFIASSKGPQKDHLEFLLVKNACDFLRETELVRTARVQSDLCLTYCSFPNITSPSSPHPQRRLISKNIILVFRQPRGQGSLGWAGAVEKWSHLKNIWKMVSLGLDDGRLRCAVDGTRDIQDNSQVFSAWTTELMAIPLTGWDRRDWGRNGLGGEGESRIFWDLSSPRCLVDAPKQTQTTTASLPQPPGKLREDRPFHLFCLHHILGTQKRPGRCVVNICWMNEEINE